MDIKIYYLISFEDKCSEEENFGPRFSGIAGRTGGPALGAGRESLSGFVPSMMAPRGHRSKQE